ncbi:cutinase family protein [Candidatus Saccharibacteria bacterium]|nr:cutinase family protein [Candidatus Saccharibacteria bacterium]
MRRKVLILISALAVTLGGAMPPTIAEAESCPDLRIVFARGSGGERWVTKDYLEFKNTIERKLATTSLNYEFIDLDYEAIGIGFNQLNVTVGAYFGGGEKYDFGDSVNEGVNNLQAMVNSSSCENTRYVIGGYSQGAIVVSKALPGLNPDKVIYAATFGDPKIYLPEGRGAIPAACSGKNLSDYRAYVPDCRAYTGLLGGIEPYQPEGFKGKLGTWCNKMDVFCSSYFGIDDHLEYDSDGLFEDASKVIFNKVALHYGINNRITSPHDTVIMLDSTSSMGSMIEMYKKEALRLSTLTFESGGRVALYDYRDLDDPYEPVEHCNFETCTIEVIQQKLNSITIDGGGDEPESLLSASFSAMKSLKWNFGSTKSVVVLTDAPFLLPDRDGVTLKEVVRLSKEIDPVNFYVITEERLEEDYRELAEQTGGMVVTDFNKLDLLTDYIMERYDSLPRVEEEEVILEDIPTIEITGVEKTSKTEVKISFESECDKVIVVLDDEVLGLTNSRTIMIGELDNNNENLITLIPVKGNLRGDGKSIQIKNTIYPAQTLIPKAPNTGKR